MQFSPLSWFFLPSLIRIFPLVGHSVVAFQMACCPFTLELSSVSQENFVGQSKAIHKVWLIWQQNPWSPWVVPQSVLEKNRLLLLGAVSSSLRSSSSMFVCESFPFYYRALLSSLDCFFFISQDIMDISGLKIMLCSSSQRQCLIMPNSKPIIVS